MSLDPLLLPENVRETLRRLRPWVIKTPLYRWRSAALAEEVGKDTKVILKLELFQNTNSFKPRGALNVMLNADAAKLKNGIVAASAGNHGIAVAYAAQQLGHSVKIFIPHTASPMRIERCKNYGAEVILCENLGEGLEMAASAEQAEGRVLVHPFEGAYTVQGTATVAAEWVRQATALLDAVIVSIGGGGLIAGMATYFKQVWPHIKVYGVEPVGAPTVTHALRAGAPVRLENISTIADSLSVPLARPYSFDLIQHYVDDTVLVTDDEMRHAMHFLFNEMKLVAEPSCAAPLAALMGPLREKLYGQRVGLLACGSNMDIAQFAKEIFRAEMV